MRNSSGKEHPVGLDARHRQVMGGSRGRQRVELSGRDTVWTPTEDARKRERCWSRHLGRSQKEVQSVSTSQHEQRFGEGGAKKRVASSGWGKVAAARALRGPSTAFLL